MKVNLTVISMDLILTNEYFLGGIFFCIGTLFPLRSKQPPFPLGDSKGVIRYTVLLMACK